MGKAVTKRQDKFMYIAIYHMSYIETFHGVLYKPLTAMNRRYNTNHQHTSKKDGNAFYK